MPKYFISDSWDDYSSGYLVVMNTKRQISEDQYNALLAFMVLEEQHLFQAELKPLKDHRYEIFMELDEVIQ